jgi:hypothetical protein
MYVASSNTLHAEGRRQSRKAPLDWQGVVRVATCSHAPPIHRQPQSPPPAPHLPLEPLQHQPLLLLLLRQGVHVVALDG